MSDHEGATVRRGARFQVHCRCGWASPWSDSQDAAEALHELHAEMAEPTAPNFDDHV